MSEGVSILELKGIGPKRAELFEKLGVSTIYDLLHLYPRTYRQYPKPAPLSSFTSEGKYPQTAVCVRLQRSPVVRKIRRMDLVIARGFEEDRNIELFWFRTPYVVTQLPTGTPIVFYGTLQREKGHLRMDQPEIYLPAAYERLVSRPQPVYPLTAGLSNTTVKSAVGLAMEDTKDLSDPLPQDLRTFRNLLPKRDAVFTMHRPGSMEELADARRRLVYDEFLMFLLYVRRFASAQQLAENVWKIRDDSVVSRIMEALPFTLTGGQQEALSGVLSDLHADTVHQRLIQGDVGSGKTVVAFIAMALMAQNGYQTALMVPTQVLARQHEQTFLDFCRMCGIDLPVFCLTGAMTKTEKRKMKEQIQAAGGALVIGTQALLEETVSLDHLALVVADEQHRFGVRQRSLMTEKGSRPHLLVMSATPIPRTLAMILYGQMQLSVISEMPKDRLKIKTAVIRENDRPKADRFLLKEIAAGHQCYCICPLVEASEELTEAQNVKDYAKGLSERLGSSVRIDILHGRMKPKEKDAVMERFAQGETDILVSTTVVEVGINVPNATVMLVENADRFGLAQLHQLRGRVGRSSMQSYCILMDTSDSGPEGNERLKVLSESADGFEIAQKDLKLRGPGDFLGVRQSGEMSFALADVFLDADVLSQASEDADRLLEQDENLSQPQHAALHAAVRELEERSYSVL